MTQWDFLLVDSLDKVLPEETPPELQCDRLTGFVGETISLQLAYSCRNDDFGESSTCFYPRIHFDIPAAVRVRKIELVPCAYPCHGTWDNHYLATKPGLYPDLLVPLTEGQEVKAIAAQWRSLWIDIEVNDLALAGEYKLQIDLMTQEGALLRHFCTPIQILPVELPMQELIHTEWFHADCLADYYHVAVFSKMHWEIIENFIKSAVRHGINMLLTPVFTPPLDTAKGGERTTVQLVGVQKTQGKYIFEFSKLQHWIELCEKNGIRYLEIAHLFTQWGAEYAPKIIGTVDGGPEEQIFGWHTPAVGGEYTKFLHEFIPALKTFLSKQGWLERTWFHISDEPHDYEVETFARAKESVSDLLKDCKVVDALSSYAIYKQGYVARPVASVDHIAPFLEEKVPHLWTYYCTVQALEVPNRFIAMPSSRNRILGVLLYYFEIEGFLHWGFNFYNAQRSVKHIDPYQVTDAGEAFPSGDPFLVYPAPDGTAFESIRGMVLRQALFDLRCLKLLEKIKGKEAVRLFVEELAGKDLSFKHYPENKCFFTNMRKKIVEEWSLSQNKKEVL